MGRGTTRAETVVALISAIAALALVVTPAAAARLPKPKTETTSRSTAATGPQLDGGLAAAGSVLCQSMPVSSSSLTERSCQALQQAVRSGSYPFLWNISQVLHATMLAGTTASPSALQQYGSEVYSTLREYADGLAFSAGLTATAGDTSGIQFYDDNSWAGLDLLDAYQLSAQPVVLEAAEGLLAFERTGEWRPTDPPDERVYPGGMYWNTQRRARPAHVAAGAAQLALELYMLTHVQSYLEFGEQEYDWVSQTLSTGNGLFYDRVTEGGTITGTTPEIGDALMIGDGVLLYRITGEKQYLDQAEQTAAASFARFTPSVAETECPAENAVLFHDLGALNSVSPLPQYPTLLKKYAAWVTQESNPQTGAFPLTQFGSACGLPLPQAGATAALILSAVG